MSYRNTISAITLTAIDSATFTGAYQLVNAGLTQPCFLLRITNNSNRFVLISYNGTTTHDMIPIGGTLQITGQSNALPHNSDTAKFPKGMPVYVLGAAGGTGSVYISGYYQPQT